MHLLKANAVYRLHGAKKASPRGSGLLSLEQGHPSMGKMTLGGQQRGGGRDGSPVERGVELQQLFIRQGQQETLEKHDGLAEAGIQVVVGGVEQFPFEFGLHGGRVAQLFRGAGEGFVQVLDELQKGRNLVKELRTLAEENTAADSVEAGGEAALGLL